MYFVKNAFNFQAKRLLLFVCVVFYTDGISAQNTDTIKQLEEVVIRAYHTDRPLLNVPSSVSVLNEQQLRDQPGFTLIPAINTLAGVRMEERSPGSYRLSIRGSLLRSPFGIRNVKIYLHDFPLTDAGGNTYLNALDAGSVTNIEILKGPDGSLFGANTGGVLVINSNRKNTDSFKITGTISGGSYSHIHEKFSLFKRWNKYAIDVNQGFQRADGYRENSALQRHYIQLLQTLQYFPKAKLQALIVFSDLKYQTPGGLTLKQLEENPHSARPATNTIPGAKEQKAGIFNRTFFGGVSHELQLLNSLKHNLAIFSSHTDFENPFITNYEVRDENTMGFRTFMEFNKRLNNNFSLKWNIGTEWQQTGSEIINYGNRGGIKDTVQASENIIARQHFYFSRISADLGKRWILEAALSLNYYQFQYKSIQPVTQSNYSNKKFDPQLMPRLAASCKITKNLVSRASISRGYSPPTVAEVRPSDNNIYANLQAETGWNYETGVRLQSNNNRFWLDASVFYFKLEDAIVRRINNLGQEYFVNAGGTDQPGLEWQLAYWLMPVRENGLLRALQLRNSFTYHAFTFSNYKNADEDFSGNRLTGIPKEIFVSSLKFQFPKAFSLFFQHNYTGEIPLNDANSVYADSYNLLQIKIGWQKHFNSSAYMEIFAGADNLLNENYSLGNDLNAFGGRYYNSAPARNYFAGISLSF